MPTDTVSAVAPVDAEPGIGPGPDPGPQPEAAPATAHVVTDTEGQIECAKQPAPVFLHSPPDSNNAAKTDASDSELSDLDDEPILDNLSLTAAQPEAEQQPEQPQVEEEDIGEVLPDHWSGAVPVFRPTMYQFKDFQRFMKKVDSYGMKSGIIKIIPPPEWKDAQPKLDELVKPIKVREPIKQDIMGSNGTYRQVNILHGRSYNLPQWRQLCEQSEHQPPARRGERRANADKPKPPRRPAAAPRSAKPSTPKKRGKGRPARGKGRQAQDEEDDRPMTPISPRLEPHTAEDKLPVDSIENDPGEATDGDEGQPSFGRMGGARQSKPKTQSVSARRKYSRREGSAMIDEAAFKDFDYLMDVSDYTPERCEELERSYWKTLTYAPPLYGADMMGTLFDERTETWNLNKLPNLLDVLGTKVPGVNTAYLYLGMWKATFAWHLEDVDLYSINYLHFGAPKQWYSISQADARRFEAAMKNIWPADAKACSQFLRHKGFLISPHHLLQHYGIKVNKVVSYPGEFVVTYPYGYHSGYNLGYNCAEAVNFALDSWLEMGKIAKKCECAQAQDSVWINVYEIERKLRGEETEYEETEDDEDEDEDEDLSGLPTPPGQGVRFTHAGGKRKRGVAKRDKAKVKKIKLRIKTKAEPACCLCPHDIPELGMLPTDDGRKAHRICALYVPETYIDNEDGKEVVCNVASIHKDRLDLKCLFCRSKRGACFQCSHKKCARAYHATCAAAAGVFVEDQDVPVFGEDGTEFKEQAFEFTCRFHRTKRDKKTDGESLEADTRIRTAAELVRKGDVCQFQFYKGEIFAGMVVDNRNDEETLLVDIIPNGDRIEVEWKWLLLPDPADCRLPKASAAAIPMPASRKAQEQLNAKRVHDDTPRKDDVFADGYTWAEFQVEPARNKDQAKIDFAKPDQIWHYLGKSSTEARAQYTEDPTNQRHNPKGNFLDTLPKPPKPAPAIKPAEVSQGSFGITGGYTYSYNPQSTLAGTGAGRPAKPYVYKPRKPIEAHANTPLMYAPQGFLPTASPSPSSPSPGMPHQNSYHPSIGYQNNGVHSNGVHSARRFESMGQPPSAHLPFPAPDQHQTGSPNVQGPLAQPAVGWQRPPPSPYQTTNASQQSRPTWHVHSSVYQKYPFFQVNHNRDSSKYRTPYAAWGGFTNGYEGDLRAHLMSKQTSTQIDLARRSSLSSMSQLPSQKGQAFEASNAQHAALPSMSGTPSFPPSAPQTIMPAEPRPHQTTPMSPPPVSEAPGQRLHPAINPQYWNARYHGQPVQQASPQVPRSRPNPAPKSYKVGLPAAVNLALKSTKPAMQSPAKQSPVPLPANFLAAMGSSPGSPAPESRPSSVKPAAQTATPFNVGSSSEVARAQHVQSDAMLTLGQETPSAEAARHSTTPVPVPRLPGWLPPVVASQGLAAKPEMALSIETAPILVPTNAQGPAPSGMYHNERDSSAQPLSIRNNLEVNCQQEFADVPGCESMEFVERMMENLKRASRRNSANIDA